jgi:outer membrane murein-binding lipoprotein Lpp
LAIEDDIAQWASGRPAWQQTVLVALAGGKTYDGNGIRELANALRTGQDFPSATLKASDLGGPQATKTVRLLGVRNATDVNALAANHHLTFGSEGLTVVYGDNGSGKSGYARLIKAAVGALHHQPIHPNVFAGVAAGGPAAEIDLDVDGTAVPASWPDGLVPELSAIDFYDEACGDSYLGGETEMTYRPAALALLDGLIAVSDAVRNVLDDDLTDNAQRRASLPAVPSGSSADAFLRSLRGQTTKSAVDAVTAEPEDADAMLGGLLQEEARLRASDPAKEQARLSQLATNAQALADHVDKLTNALSDERLDATKAAVSRATELRAAATVASQKTFDAEPLTGVGSDTWRALWNAARTYSTAVAYPGHEFPHTSDARCVLCQQELDEEAGGRLDRFEAFLRDTTARDAAEAESKADGMVAELRSLDITPTSVVTAIATVEAADAPLAAATRTWLAAADARKTDVLAVLNGGDDTVGALAAQPALRIRGAEWRQTAGAIDKSEFDRTLARITRDKEHLEGTRALAQHRAGIEAEIERLAERESIEQAKRWVDTATITRKSTELSETYVTSTVRDRFTRESDRLGLERIELKRTGGYKGKIRHRPALLGARVPRPVTEVLSEGEQTALGLAGFFTSAHFDDSNSALVLDDPVSSLDHIRRPRVAQRLVELASDRQVIVFTHDITFVSELRRAAESTGVTVTDRCVERHGDKTPGLCGKSHPWKVKDVKARLGQLEADLDRLEARRIDLTGADYEKECADWAGRLSEAWERIVRAEIIAPVVDPATDFVQPKQFRLLAKITEDDNDEFQHSYARISGWLRRHDAPPQSNPVAPEPQEMRDELARVRTWFDRVRKYKQ